MLSTHFDEKSQSRFCFGFGKFGNFASPGELAGIQGADADLVGFGGSDLADPCDAETRFAVPAPFDFDDFSGGGEVGHAIKACAVFADVQGVRTLGKGIPVAVFPADKNAKRLSGALAATRLAPKVRSGFWERKTYFVAASYMRLFENHAHFLLLARKFADEEKAFANINGSDEPDQGTAGVEEHGSSVFVERAERLAPAVDDDRDGEGFAVARAPGFFCCPR